MPTLNISGRSVTVDDSFLKLSPDQQNDTVDEIARSMPAAPQQSSPSLGGIAKQLATGAVAGTLGFPGDAASLLNKGIDWASGKVGLPVAPSSDVGTSDQIARGLEKATGVPLEPQNEAEAIARRVGGFASGAIGGPAGVGARLLRVLGPALGSETAGQLTKGTAAEPIARIAGAVAGGGVGALPKAANAAVPAVDELKAAARAGYQHPEVAAVEIKPQAVSNLAFQIHSDLAKDGFRPITTPKAFGVVNELQVPKGIASVKIADLDSVHKALGNVAREVDTVGRPTADAAAASRAVKRLDDFLGNLKQPDLLAGDASLAVPILNDARKNWGAAMRAEDLGVRLTRAERQAAKAGSGANIQNAIKQKVSAVLDVPQRSVGYSAAEKAQAERVVRGSPAENLLRKAGKLGFNDGLTLMAHAAAAVPSGGASIPIGVAGTIARKAAEKMTSNQAQKLEEMLRARSPLAQQRVASATVPPRSRLSPLQRRLMASALALPRPGQTSP